MSVNRVLRKVPGELLDSQVNDIHLALIARDLKRWEELAPLLGLTEAQVWNAESARIVDFAIDFVIGFVIDFMMKIDLGIDFFC